MLYDWIKALHVIAVISWMAGLFYLPRLFVYHAERGQKGAEPAESFQIMEDKLLRLIMNPAMIATWLAGLALVPQDLLNAAQVDGAGAWHRLVRVILPMIKPAILVALLFRTLDAFRIFDNIYVLTAGSNDTGSVSILGYDNLFKAFNLGLGSAISVLVFLCVAIIAFIFIRIFGAAAPGADQEGR